jgi:hypothetical protein
MSMNAFHILATRKRKKAKSDFSTQKGGMKDGISSPPPHPLSPLSPLSLSPDSLSPVSLSPNSRSPPAPAPANSSDGRIYSIYNAMGVKKPVNPKILIRDPTLPLLPLQDILSNYDEDLTDNVLSISINRSFSLSFFFQFFRTLSFFLSFEISFS